MTREIKFRGKHIDSGEWLIGDLVQDHFGDGSINTCHIYPKDAWNGPDCYEVDPSTVGQYTGLKDDKDEEIYEGDIVRDEYEGIAKVHFDSYSWQLIYGIGDDGDQVQSFEELDDLRMAIIGNIHDNPELLKGGER